MKVNCSGCSASNPCKYGERCFNDSECQSSLKCIGRICGKGNTGMRIIITLLVDLEYFSPTRFMLLICLECSATNPCGNGEGLCKDDSTCKSSLLCGKGNCPTQQYYLGIQDCCYDPGKIIVP